MISTSLRAALSGSESGRSDVSFMAWMACPNRNAQPLSHLEYSLGFPSCPAGDFIQRHSFCKGDELAVGGHRMYCTAFKFSGHQGLAPSTESANFIEVCLA
jgi:hypothetical protein